MVRVLAAVICVAGVVASAASPAPVARGSLRLVDENPMTIAGKGFKARERVTVTAVTPGAAPKKVVYASRGGTLSARFPTLQGRDVCVLIVRAAGASGTRAVLRLADRMCPPPLVP